LEPDSGASTNVLEKNKKKHINMNYVKLLFKGMQIYNSCETAL